ncbi:NUDIX domain-containing protein [Lachnospiraceae bacterium 45-P1]
MEIRMKLTTLCYLERDGKYLMLHRVRKKQDVNKDKWIGIGGKFEFGESPEDCLLREALEETGYRLTSYRLRGIVTFLFNEEEAEYMFLYTADGFLGEPVPCSEGTLEWVPKEEIDRLNLWEGDRIFFGLLKEDAPFFSLKLHYMGDRLFEAVLDGVPMELLDVLDENGKPSGLVRERTMVHLRGDYHRTSHVWVVRRRMDGKYELLLQKRSAAKDSFGGCYDISSAGHIPAGGDYRESAVRELFEELGILADAKELRFIGFHEGRYEGTFNGRLFKNHEKSAVFLYEKPVEESAFTLQESEVESVLWMELHEIEQAVREKRPDFCLFHDEIELLISCLEGREG